MSEPPTVQTLQSGAGVAPATGALAEGPSDTSATLEMEVFRAGDYGPKGTWTPQDLDQLARDYSPELLEAPLTFDHARSGPAFGWVKSLRCAGDRLVALISGVPEVVRELIRRGAYKKRSVELLRRFVATGRPYLRAVSLLGAATPAVPGLREVHFAADETVVSFDDDAEIMELRQAVANLQAELGTLRRERAQAAAASLLSDSRVRGVPLTPRECELIEAFCLAYAHAADVVRFAGEEISPLDWLRQLLAARAPELPEGELSAFSLAAKAGPPAETAIWSDRVDPASVVLHQRTQALRESAPELSYAAALIAAARGGAAQRPPSPHQTH